MRGRTPFLQCLDVTNPPHTSNDDDNDKEFDNIVFRLHNSFTVCKQASRTTQPQRKYTMSKALAMMVKQATAPKAAPVKGKAKQAPVAKPLTKSVQPATAKPVFACTIVTGRPDRQASLFTFTAAWMEMVDFMNGGMIEKALADKIAGPTAINWHIKNGRFEKVEGMVRITDGGRDHFAKRANDINKADKAAWMAILSTGKADGRLIESDSHLKAL